MISIGDRPKTKTAEKPKDHTFLCNLPQLFLLPSTENHSSDGYGTADGNGIHRNQKMGIQSCGKASGNTGKDRKPCCWTVDSSWFGSQYSPFPP